MILIVVNRMIVNNYKEKEYKESIKILLLIKLKDSVH
jgi:hypothetical protein